MTLEVLGYVFKQAQPDEVKLLQTADKPRLPVHL